ncbi:MAG: DUF3391 domain-containing protein [Pseudorhodoferax sp.]
MYVHEFCGSWMDHPFWRAKFLVGTEAQLAKVRGSGVQELWIDTDKGLDIETGIPEAEVRSMVEQELEHLATMPAPLLPLPPGGGRRCRAGPGADPPFAAQDHDDVHRCAAGQGARPARMRGHGRRDLRVGAGQAARSHQRRTPEAPRRVHLHAFRGGVRPHDRPGAPARPRTTGCCARSGWPACCTMSARPPCRWTS